MTTHIVPFRRQFLYPWIKTLNLTRCQVLNLKSQTTADLPLQKSRHSLPQSSQSLPSSPLSSSSSSLEVFASSDEPKTRCYQNDPLMPIYKISSKSIDTKEATTALLTTEDEDVLAKNIPLHINKNVSFVYSI